MSDKDRRVLRNIYHTKSGWRLYVSVKGESRPKRIHDPRHNMDIEVLKVELAKWDVEARRPRNEPTDNGDVNTLDRDVPIYLSAVASMPSIRDRTQHMREWAETFRGRARDTVTPLEIRTRLEGWRRTHAAGSCNHRRTALMHFYTVMNGKSGYNPVRDVPKYAEEEEPRDVPLWTIYRILACMPDSATRARLRVFIWTGWPHATLMRVKESHVDLARARAWITRRRKGKGHRAGWLPLLPGAIIALKALKRHNGFGPFWTAPMHVSFQRGIRKYNAHRARFGHPPIKTHPYAIRHSFGTWVADHLEDDRVLNELMLHSRPEQSLRYTRRATERRLERGVATLRAVTARIPQGKTDAQNVTDLMGSRK